MSSDIRDLLEIERLKRRLGHYRAALIVVGTVCALSCVTTLGLLYAMYLQVKP